MKIEHTTIPGVLVVTPDVYTDERGFFLETYNARTWGAAGITDLFVQDNHSRSAAGTVRGLHYQLRHPQSKLIRVVQGTVYDVAVDIRRGSPTFGQWVGVELSEQNKRQLFIPAGFAHGFCVPTERADVEYKCGALYAADDQHGVAWDDPTLAIPWPVSTPVLSAKDRAYAPLRVARDDLPQYGA